MGEICQRCGEQRGPSGPCVHCRRRRSRESYHRRKGRGLYACSECGTTEDLLPARNRCSRCYSIARGRTPVETTRDRYRVMAVDLIAFLEAHCERRELTIAQVADECGVGATRIATIRREMRRRPETASVSLSIADQVLTHVGATEAFHDGSVPVYVRKGYQLIPELEAAK